MKVTIYTINDCKFSQAEKDYLKTNNIAFEEKNVEQNRDFLTEMLGISENFAGTPVTKIEKDDGTSNVLKGFTQEEFDKELMAYSPTENTAAPTVPPASPSIGGSSDVLPPMSPMPPKEMNTPVQTPVDTQTMPISLSDNPVTPQPVVEPVVQSAPDATAAPRGPAPDQLNSVLENLQSQVNTPVVPVSPVGGPAPKI